MSKVTGEIIMSLDLTNEAVDALTVPTEHLNLSSITSLAEGDVAEGDVRNLYHSLATVPAKVAETNGTLVLTPTNGSLKDVYGVAISATSLETFYIENVAPEDPEDAVDIVITSSPYVAAFALKSGEAVLFKNLRAAGAITLTNSTLLLAATVKVAIVCLTEA